MEIKETNSLVQTVKKFAVMWAEEMEKEMSKGQSLYDIALDTENKIEKQFGGITGSIHGASIAMLRQYWEYGEKIYIWNYVRILSRGGF